MMLNGLQTSSKALLLDSSAAKLQSMDAGTTEPVSFGKLLKLKEKQMQLEQEVSASIVAAAFASLQTPQLVSLLPIQIMETGGTAPAADVSKASADAISQTITTSSERSDVLSLIQAPAPHVGVTESIHSKFPAVFNSVNENTSQQALVKTVLSDAPSSTSFGKTTTVAAANSPTTDRPVYFTEQFLAAKVAKIAPVTEQVPASVSSPNLEAIPAGVAIKPAEPLVSAASTITKASPPAHNTGTTTKIDIAGEDIKTDTITASQTNRNPEISTQPLSVTSITSKTRTSEGANSTISSAAQTVIMSNEEGRTKADSVPAFAGVKSNSSESTLFPNTPFRVSPNQEASKSPSAMPDAAEDRQGSDLQTLEVPVDSQSMEAQIAESNRTSVPGNDSGFVQPETKENIRVYQTAIKDNKSVFEPLPVKTTEDVPTRNSPTEIGTDNSAIQQTTTSPKDQQSNSSHPAFPVPSSIAFEINTTEKMQITSPTEDQSKDGTLLLHNTVEEVVSTDEIDLTEIPVSKSTFRQQFVTSTDANLRSVNVTSANSVLETHINPTSPHEVELPAVHTLVQEQDNSIRPYQPGSQTVKAQAEQSSIEKVSMNETTNDQTNQSAFTSFINDAPSAGARAAFTDILAAESIGNQLFVTQSVIDLKNSSQDSEVQVEVMSDPHEVTTSTANAFEANLTTTQTVIIESGDTRAEAGEMASSLEMPSPSPIRDSSSLSSTLVDGAPPISQFAGESQWMEVSKTRVMEKIGNSASEHPLAEIGAIQTPDQLDKVNTFETKNNMPAIASIKPAIEIISGETVPTSAEATPTLEIEPETEANKQVIISEPDQDLSHVATTKFEKNITLASWMVEKKINTSAESSEIYQKSPAYLSAAVVVPIEPELSEAEAGTSLQTSSVAESLENVFNSDAASNVRSFQSVAESIETKSDQRQIKADIPISEQVVTEPSKILATDFEINAQKLTSEPNFEEKLQGAETNLDNLHAAAKSETLETPDANRAIMMMDFAGVENITSERRYVEFDNTADLTRHVLTKTDSTVGNKDIADGELPVRESRISSNRDIETGQLTGSQSRAVFSKAKIEEIEKSDFAAIGSQSSVPGNSANILHVDMRISADGDLSKSSTDENISVQTTQDTKTADTVPHVSDDASSQPEVTKAVEAKNGETQIHVDIPMDQPAQNGTIQFHENKSRADVEVKPVGFKSPGGGADEKINTRTESINDVRPASHQAPGVVEIVNDPIAPALPNAHTVNGPDVTRQPKHIENDEKALPVEKQSGLNQTPGIAAPANGPVRETAATYRGGNVPSNQLSGDLKEVVDHVIRHINSNLKNGPTSMRLQLSPRELGAIDVQMVSDSQGVHVTFFAEQASTGKLLETQLDQLRVSLLDSGVHLSGLDIGQHNQSGQKGGSFEQSPNFTRDFSRNFPDAQIVSQEESSLERILGRSSDIDYLI